MIDERPALAGRKMGRAGPQVRAGAAAEIDHSDRVSIDEERLQASEKLRIARLVIGRLAKRQPVRSEAAHQAASCNTAATLRTVSAQRGKSWPAAQEASAQRQRSAGSAIMSRRASRRAGASPGG